MNVPRLRFKEFNKSYNTKEIKEITYNVASGKISKPVEDGNYNIYGSMGKIGTSNFYDYEGEKVLVARVGANAGSVNKINEKCCISDNTLVLEPKDVLNDYLYYSLKHYNPQKLIFGSGQPLVTGGQLKQIKLGIPEEKEQLKVANFLSLLDKKIELQTKKIEALKLFKKGLFDTQLKTNEKELIMFDDFLDEATEKSSIQNQYPVLSSTSKGLFLQSDYFKKQASSENNVGYKILKRNQLVLSPQNLWMGNININNIFDIGIVSPSYRVYNIDIKKIDLNYFNYWIKTPKALYSYLISSEQGASIVRRNLNIEMFNQISLKIPDLEKQHIIGNRIYQFYLKINLEEEKLKLLYKLKKGLMQNMFI